MDISIFFGNGEDLHSFSRFKIGNTDAEFFGTHIMWICTGIFVEVDDFDWFTNIIY
jgi:hypothetical protein